MNAKIKINNLAKLKEVCEINEIEIIDSKSYGKTGTAIVQLKFKQASQLFNAGRDFESYDKDSN